MCFACTRPRVRTPALPVLFGLDASKLGLWRTVLLEWLIGMLKQILLRKLITCLTRSVIKLKRKIYLTSQSRNCLADPSTVSAILRRCAVHLFLLHLRTSLRLQSRGRLTCAVTLNTSTWYFLLLVGFPYTLLRGTLCSLHPSPAPSVHRLTGTSLLLHTMQLSLGLICSRGVIWIPGSDPTLYLEQSSGYLHQTTTNLWRSLLLRSCPTWPI